MDHVHEASKLHGQHYTHGEPSLVRPLFAGPKISGRMSQCAEWEDLLWNRRSEGIEKSGGISIFFGYSERMASRSHIGTVRTGARKRRARRITLAAVRRHVRSWRRGSRAMAIALWTLPPAIRFLVGAIIIVLTCSAINWAYHAMRKPTEIFFPLDKTFDKRPLETWREYGSLFRQHSTAV